MCYIRLHFLRSCACLTELTSSLDCYLASIFSELVHLNSSKQDCKVSVGKLYLDSEKKAISDGEMRRVASSFLSRYCYIGVDKGG